MRSLKEIIRDEVQEMKMSPWFHRTDFLLGKVGKFQVQLVITKQKDDFLENEDAMCQKEINQIMKG